MKLAFLFAMQAEAEAFIQLIDAQLFQPSWPSWLPFKAYRSQHETHDILVLVSGKDARHSVDHIGLEPATLMSYLVIQHWQPALVISAGTCGGFANNGAHIGTVYLADTFLFHDRHVPLPGFQESSIGHVKTGDATLLANKLALPVTVVSSGSSLLKQDSDLQVMARFDVGAKEMEAAAIAWVCQLADTPMLALKSVTNLLDEADSSEQQFIRHFSLAVQTLTRQCQRLVQHI